MTPAANTVSVAPSVSTYQNVRRARRLLRVSRARIAEYISGASNRLDERRRARFVYLAAQMRHIHVDDVAAAVERAVPHVLGNHCPRQDRAGAPHEVLEQCVFLACERDRPGAAPGRPRGGIELQVPDLERGGSAILNTFLR